MMTVMRKSRRERTGGMRIRGVDDKEKSVKCDMT